MDKRATVEELIAFLELCPKQSKVSFMCPDGYEDGVISSYINDDTNEVVLAGEHALNNPEGYAPITE